MTWERRARSAVRKLHRNREALPYAEEASLGIPAQPSARGAQLQPATSSSSSPSPSASCRPAATGQRLHLSQKVRCREMQHGNQKEVLLVATWLNCPNQAYKKLMGLKSHQPMLAVVFHSQECWEGRLEGPRKGQALLHAVASSRGLRRDLQPEFLLARPAATWWLLGEAHTHDSHTVEEI